ncbi:MAG: zinc-ribbon and DUF3426 domain-containing protein [Zoogloeaceae bacterium]|nr:zinc-ribbon and DUF3426 domain-containing protein [Zoogloeaceae bacterium]
MTITRCPACSTAFRVSREQLALRNGRVRCGHCYRPFDALAHRIADDPEPTPEPPSQLPPVIQPRRAIDPPAASRPSAVVRPAPAREPEPPSAPTPDTAASLPEPEIAPLSELPDLDFHVPEMPFSDEPDTWIDTDPRTELRWKPVEEHAGAPEAPGHPWRGSEAPRGPVPDAPDADLPSPAPAGDSTLSTEQDVEHWRAHAYAPPVKPVRHRWLWALCIGMLLGILGAQASYIWREPITRQWPQLRPLYLEACASLGCDMPLPRVIGALAIERSNLEFSAPGSPYYELQAVVRNRASYPQQVPHIELTLTDTADQPLVRRALTPAEWLPRNFKAEDGIAAGARIEFTLPFSARELKGVTGFRVVAFYP